MFHSSARVYADSDRSRLLHDLAEIGTLYSNLKKTKLVSNVLCIVTITCSFFLLLMNSCQNKGDKIIYIYITQLALLLQAYIRSIHKGKGDHDNEVNPLWIVDDLFHFKKKFASLRLDQIQLGHILTKPFFFFFFKFQRIMINSSSICMCVCDVIEWYNTWTDNSVYMKHLSWIIRRVCEEKRESDELNTKMCQLQLQRSQRTLEQWLKFLHDGVKAYVIGEIIALYTDICASKDDVISNPQSAYTDYVTFVLECFKISAETAVLKEQYEIGMILNDSANDDVPPSSHESKDEENKEDADSKTEKEAKTAEPENTDVVAQQLKKNQDDLLEYFRDESKRKEWFEFVDEIEQLIKDDSHMSITLWKRDVFTTIPQVTITNLKSLKGGEGGGGKKKKGQKR
ncbi:hypothetical protein RFI_19200 [Reticulomyxa filosa]|uniref:Uncharacterized protein n=1 Tax=Reticulomyxa filosa TaxID=46433 RepID=X6MWS0_RETFI|nr:hypothetical protein RFI_19200 [Reticulomyxa filosa]|eukprot:ETO18091.1 hypothetical protein RFI_19200 [Reticulomyxa filosa]